jgi:peptidoglycan/xylan/chitin deacetylase (PgdA/CDA1 family)
MSANRNFTFLRRILLPLTIVLLAMITSAVGADPVRTTVFLIGDSTVKNGTRGQMGWGSVVAKQFDEGKVRVENRALGGRSSRTYLREGLWEKVLAEMHPGDFVVMQFGHNDNGPFDDGKARASIKGNGDETREVTLKETGANETVHSYGWYLRRYIADSKAKGVTPIVCSLIPRNIWQNGKVIRAAGDFGTWARDAAQQGGAFFVDLNQIVADRYDALGQEAVQPFFTLADHTHTSPAGAELNAACVAEGIRALDGCTLRDILRPTATASRVPDKIIALTFDDASASHAAFVAPLLKKFGFGATFFVCEFPPDFEDKAKYMRWEQIAELHRMGFEIGSHTRSHKHVDKMRPGELEAELEYIEKSCTQHGIPRPVTFAYPAYVSTPDAVEVLEKRGYKLARVGGGRAFDPAKDNPRLVPSFSTTGTDEKAAERVIAAIREAHDGKIVVLTIHGVPDTAHPQVTTEPKLSSATSLSCAMKATRSSHCAISPIISLRQRSRRRKPSRWRTDSSAHR